MSLAQLKPNPEITNKTREVLLFHLNKRKASPQYENQQISKEIQEKFYLFNLQISDAYGTTSVKAYQVMFLYYLKINDHNMIIEDAINQIFEEFKSGTLLINSSLDKNERFGLFHTNIQQIEYMIYQSLINPNIKQDMLFEYVISRLCSFIEEKDLKPPLLIYSLQYLSYLQKIQIGELQSMSIQECFIAGALVSEEKQIMEIIKFIKIIKTQSNKGLNSLCRRYLLTLTFNEYTEINSTNQNQLEAAIKYNSDNNQNSNSNIQSSNECQQIIDNIENTLNSANTFQGNAEMGKYQSFHLGQICRNLIQSENFEQQKTQILKIMGTTSDDNMYSSIVSSSRISSNSQQYSPQNLLQQKQDLQTNCQQTQHSQQPINGNQQPLTNQNKINNCNNQAFQNNQRTNTDIPPHQIDQQNNQTVQNISQYGNTQSFLFQSSQSHNNNNNQQINQVQYNQSCIVSFNQQMAQQQQQPNNGWQHMLTNQNTISNCNGSTVQNNQRINVDVTPSQLYQQSNLALSNVNLIGSVQSNQFQNYHNHGSNISQQIISQQNSLPYGASNEQNLIRNQNMMNNSNAETVQNNQQTNFAMTSNQIQQQSNQIILNQNQIGSTQSNQYQNSQNHFNNINKSINQTNGTTNQQMSFQNIEKSFANPKVIVNQNVDQIINQNLIDQLNERLEDLDLIVEDQDLMDAVEIVNIDENQADDVSYQQEYLQNASKIIERHLMEDPDNLLLKSSIHIMNAFKYVQNIDNEQKVDEIMQQSFIFIENEMSKSQIDFEKPKKSIQELKEEALQRKEYVSQIYNQSKLYASNLNDNNYQDYDRSHIYIQNQNQHYPQYLQQSQVQQNNNNQQNMFQQSMINQQQIMQSFNNQQESQGFNQSYINDLQRQQYQEYYQQSQYQDQAHNSFQNNNQQHFNAYSQNYNHLLNSEVLTNSYIQDLQQQQQNEFPYHIGKQQQEQQNQQSFVYIQQRNQNQQVNNNLQQSELWTDSYIHDLQQQQQDQYPGQQQINNSYQFNVQSQINQIQQSIVYPQNQISQIHNNSFNEINNIQQQQNNYDNISKKKNKQKQNKQEKINVQQRNQPQINKNKQNKFNIKNYNNNNQKFKNNQSNKINNNVEYQKNQNNNANNQVNQINNNIFQINIQAQNNQVEQKQEIQHQANQPQNNTSNKKVEADKIKTQVKQHIPNKVIEQPKKEEKKSGGWFWKVAAVVGTIALCLL